MFCTTKIVGDSCMSMIVVLIFCVPSSVSMTSSKESTLFLILEGIMRYDAELDPSQTNVCSVT